MTNILFVPDKNNVLLSQHDETVDQLILKISNRTLPLPDDTRVEDWIEVNGVLIIALASIPNRIDRLSLRQREILEYFLQGRTRTYIAEKLEIQPVTVDFHFQAVKNHFQVRSRNELLAAYAIERYRTARRFDRFQTIVYSPDSKR